MKYGFHGQAKNVPSNPQTFCRRLQLDLSDVRSLLAADCDAFMAKAKASNN